MVVISLFTNTGEFLIRIIYSNRITRDGTKELAKVLKENTAIETLDLGYNRLEDDGAMHIADALATMNTTLKW